MRAAAVAVRYCTRPSCGQRHHDPAYNWCLACRLLGRDWGAAYRADHARRGLCQVCVASQEKGRARCDYHLEYAREHNVKYRAEQRKKGLCTWGRCPRKAYGAWHCDEHLERMNVIRRASARRLKRRRGR